MSIRLYDTAWIELEGQAGPVGEHAYDIDGRADISVATSPRIVRVLSLQTVREVGLTMMAHEVPVAHIAVRSVRSAARGAHQKLLEIA